MGDSIEIGKIKNDKITKEYLSHLLKLDILALSKLVYYMILLNLQLV